MSRSPPFDFADATLRTNGVWSESAQILCISQILSCWSWRRTAQPPRSSAVLAGTPYIRLWNKKTKSAIWTAVATGRTGTARTDHEMLSVPTSLRMRALRFSLVSGLLMGLLELLGTPLSPALSEPQPSLVRKSHRAAGVRWCAAHGHADIQARRYGQGYSRHAPGQQASWIMRGNVAAEPFEPGSDSEDCPDPLEIVPAGVSCPALVRTFVYCPRTVDAVFRHIAAVQSRAPPPVVA
jgi:hypothetical protein